MRKAIRGTWRRFGGSVLSIACGLAAMTAADLRADYVSTITADAPKAWYRFEDASTAAGAAVADSSGNGINGEYRSFMQQANGPAGIGGNAGAFDGIDSYVDTLAANESQFDFIGSSFTFEAWVQAQAFNKTWQAIAAKGDNSWRIARRGDSNSPSFAANGLAGEPALFTLIDDGQWHHIVGVVDLASGQKKEYVDGVLNPDVQLHDGSIDNSDFPLYIGENSQATGRFWQGAIDEVAIYDKALTDAQVLAHFNAGGGIQAGSTLPAPVLGAPVTAEPLTGAEGLFGVRVVRASAAVNGTAGADAALANPAYKFERYITDGYVSMLNLADPGAPGGGYSVIPDPKIPLPGDRAGAEDNIAVLAQGKILIPADGQYTFGIDGDDGTRLKLSGANFTLQACGDLLGTPPGCTAVGDTLEKAADTGNAFALGSTFLTAGEHTVAMVWNEAGGGAFFELFAAPGIKTELDNTFATPGSPGKTYTGGVLPTVPGGFDVIERIRLPENTQFLNSLADTNALFDNPLEPDDEEFTGTVPVINFQDPDAGSTSRIGGDVPFLNDLATVDDNDFGVKATGTLHVETAATYTFGFTSDDGNALTITGGVFDAITAGGGGVAAIINGGQTLAFDANTGDSFTLATMTLAPGDYPLEYLMWERGGGASAEVFVGPGAKTEFDATFRLLGIESSSPTIVYPVGLEVVGDPLGQLGDTDGDGDVDLVDLNNVRNNFGGTTGGDTNGDGQVDLVDLNNVRNNFGIGGANPVPEPSSLSLIGLGLVGLLAARRFRK